MALSISLKPNQLVGTPLTSAQSTINGANILSALIVDAYSKQMGYNVGDSVSIGKENIRSFTQDDTVYYLFTQQDVLFKIDIIP